MGSRPDPAAAATAWLQPRALPAFSAFDAAAVEPAMDAALARARAALATLGTHPPSWADTALGLERLRDELDRIWSPVRHLHSVADSPALREAYQHCLPRLTALYTDIGQDATLYQHLESLQEQLGDAADPQQRAWLEQTLRDMRLTGAGLDAGARRRLAAIASRLAELGARFSENVLDASQAWTLAVDDPARLAGLPQDTLDAARRAATAGGRDGALLKLDFPVYHAVQCHARDRELRETLYRAWSTRASEQPPSPAAHDNGPLMAEILGLRHEAAQLLGFANHAQRALSTRMARSPQQVLGFLRELAASARPAAAAELERLRRFAAERDGLHDLQPWDVTFYIERLRETELELDQEALRPYFPLSRVLQGLFTLLERLFGVRVEAVTGADVWHPDVRLYRLRDLDGSSRGAFYLDPFARQGKRGGAWMDECRTRNRLHGALQDPVAYLTCNFAPPLDGGEALLTHDEVTTLFHETGHALHHLLTDVELPAIGGINGVAWDAVELPSQMLENWCWEAPALRLLSGHHQSGAALPDATVERLRAARSFMAGLQFVRQLEFALFDMRLHLEYVPGDAGIVQRLLDEVRAEVAVIEPPAWNRFAHAFTHIFAGGYSAGYYSYKWAEVLSSDAFSRFEEDGLFDADAGRDFRACVLARGASEPAESLYRRFRGREPRVDALLRHSGLAGAGAATT